MISTQALAQLGAVQGIFLFIAILSRGWRKPGNTSLAALAMIIAVRLLPAAFGSVHEGFENSGYQSVFNALIFLFSPLLWVYVRNLTGNSFSGSTVKHIIPFIIVLCTGLLTRGNIRLLVFNITGGVLYLYLIVYQIIMLFELHHFTSIARNYISNPEKVDLYWFRMLMLGSIILILGNFVADYGSFIIQSPEWIIFLPFITSNMFLFGIAFLAIRYPEIDPEIQETRVQIENDIFQGKEELRYKKNRMDTTTELKILNNLIKHLEENESFRNDELKLSDLSKETGYASNTISMVLNIHQKENFYQFINRYRIEAAKLAFSDTKRSSESILKIAFDSGFRSKSTFNTLFKEVTGKTPSKFRSG